MQASSETIEERMRVWIPLSEFFLDTELDASQLDRIAGILAASTYSEAQLEEILRAEISPVCSWNLLSVAGEWQGFDETWLRSKLVSRIGNKSGLFSDLRWRMDPVKRTWETVEQRIRQLRKAG